MEIINPPPGHGPWCCCAQCGTVLTPEQQAHIAAGLYKQQLEATNDQLWKLQVEALKNNRYARERALRDERLLTIAALQNEERAMRDERLLTIAELQNANAELRARLANVEYQQGYFRYAPPSQMRFEREVEYRTIERPARRSPAFTLAIIGMLVALAIVSQILLWFH